MSRFREPFEKARQEHDEVVQAAREVLVATTQQAQTLGFQRPRLRRLIVDRLEGLWRDCLGLRPRLRWWSLRWWNKWPEPPRQSIGKHLLRFRRKRLGAYRKTLWLLGRADTDSLPARARHLEMAAMRFRIWLTPFWAVVLLVPVLLLLLKLLAPEALESFFNLLTPGTSGP